MAVVNPVFGIFMATDPLTSFPFLSRYRPCSVTLLQSRGRLSWEMVMKWHLLCAILKGFMEYMDLSFSKIVDDRK